MNDLIKMIAAASTATAVATAFSGCGESSESKSAGTHSLDHGHAHTGEGDDHEGHDHAEGKPGEMRSLGSVTIAGTILAVSVSSDIRPSSEVLLELEVESGPIPAAVRFWVGDEAGTGALKSKTDAHEDHFHGQTEAPETVDGASLWIEVETASGERQAVAVPLQ